MVKHRRATAIKRMLMLLRGRPVPNRTLLDRLLQANSSKIQIDKEIGLLEQSQCPKTVPIRIWLRAKTVLIMAKTRFKATSITLTFKWKSGSG